VKLERLWNWPAGKGGTVGERRIDALAQAFSKSERTIERELERGGVSFGRDGLPRYDGYDRKEAQAAWEKNKGGSGPMEKIGSDMELARDISDKIRKEHKSPYAVWACYEKGAWPTKSRISVKTIYRYVAKGILPECSEKDLLRKGGTKKRERKEGKSIRHVADGHSISERPQGANDRTEMGHWEHDTVHGPIGSKPCLFTMTSRKLRCEIIRRLENCTEDAVKTEIDKIERLLGDKFSSFFITSTADNGSESADSDLLEFSCIERGKKRMRIYYAHAYHSCERGTNENHNGMIRRFFPKGTDFTNVTDAHVLEVQRWMNTYPRKILGGLSPLEALEKELGPSHLLLSLLLGIP
jgi:IS30 family transposase